MQIGLNPKFIPEGKFLISKLEFRGSFGMSLDGDCHENEVISNLVLSVTFCMSGGSLS
jgi:hypothetical protein